MKHASKNALCVLSVVVAYLSCFINSKGQLFDLWYLACVYTFKKKRVLNLFINKIIKPFNNGIAFIFNKHLFLKSTKTQSLRGINSRPWLLRYLIDLCLSAGMREKM